MKSKFQILSTPSFEREFKKILKKDKNIIKIFEVSIEVLQDNPFGKNSLSNIKKLTDIKQGEGEWRIRLKDYRVRYDIIKNKVILHSIKNRKDAYK